MIALSKNVAVFVACAYGAAKNHPELRLSAELHKDREILSVVLDVSFGQWGITHEVAATTIDSAMDPAFIAHSCVRSMIGQLNRRTR